MEKIIVDLKDFIKREKLPLYGNRLLCAVSGGVDSVVMVYLLKELGFEIEIAHANFQLRGEESNRDELFVRELSKKLNVPYHIKQFDTNAYAAHQKLSIQVAARELRYEWFKELTHQNLQLKFICTAHHADDNVETMMMNFFKGTGMLGLKGIPVMQKNLIRPLLFATKDQIIQYAIVSGINFVQDSSNESEKYTRNFFRNNVIPLLQERIPEVLSNLRDNISRFRDAEILYKEAVHHKIKKLLIEEADGSFKLPVEKLKLTSPLPTIIYEIFSRWGFHSAQVPEIIKLIDRQTGKMMYSHSHKILKNRNWLIISPIEYHSSLGISLESIDAKVQFELGTISCKMKHDIHELDSGMNTILIDPQKVNFPLIIRKWRQGDYFYPLGMKKKKKISRFLIDSKISMNNKEKIWVLESERKILWIIGLRMDDRFKILPGQKKQLEIVLKANES